MSTSTYPSPSAAAAAGVPRGAGEVLDSARAARARADAAEVQVLIDAVEWAVQNPPLFAREAATGLVPTTQGAAPVRADLTAEGVPDVCRAAVAEFGLALGVSTQAAQALTADALELAYRLPHAWARVIAGEVRPWRARQLAQRTRPLARLAAAYVDQQVAAFIHHATGPQLDGLIETAMTRYDPDLAAELAAARAEQRHVEVHLDQTSITGLTPVEGVLDLPDAQDLDAALSHSATQLALWGSQESLNARRARALGELAREHLTLTGEPATADKASEQLGGTATTERPDGPTAPTKRQAVLYVHVTDYAIREAIAGRSGGCGRVENTGQPVTADTIRDWIGDPHTKVSIRPVLDLAEQMRADTYTSSLLAFGNRSGYVMAPASFPAAAPKGSTSRSTTATPTTTTIPSKVDKPRAATGTCCASCTTTSRPTTGSGTPSSPAEPCSGAPHTASASAATPTAPSNT